ncbi:MAG: uroporphyrinogen-III synthase [Planctomycetaceae bacterium]|jgi:uroporphyrinogen III methyltransferase/synthase|nr:uroporphyrinogen-III synthase [Planctomycetaceae bacterium]
MTTVLLTRPENQNDKLKSELELLGATVLLQPAIEILPVESWGEVDAVVARVGEFDWVLFTSSNGVRFFMNRLGNIKFPDSVKVGVVGNGTDDVFFECSKRRANFVPEINNAEGMLTKILTEKIDGKKFLLPRGNRGRNVLSKGIIEAGGIVEEIVVYRSVDCKVAKPEIADQIKRGQIDWVTATSPAIAESLVNMFGESLRKIKIISISPITTTKLIELGFPPQTEAKETTINAIINEILFDTEAGMDGRLRP